VHILTAQNLPQESGGLLERALSGSSCDPYVVTTVPNSFGADVAITRPKAADSNPDFYERFFLYVEDPRAAGAALELTVKDKNLLRGDDVIGTCRLPLSELRAPADDAEQGGGLASPPVLEWSGTLDIVVRVCVCVWRRNEW
jgi:Ca2+-dependent lipid-binding protein